MLKKSRLTPKGAHISVSIKKNTVNVTDFTKQLQNKGFRVSPYIPNMAVMAMSSDLKCMIDKDTLEIQLDNYAKISSNILDLKLLMNPYVVNKGVYQINLDVSFLVGGNFSIDDIMNAIYNSKARVDNKLYTKPVGFRVVIVDKDIPYIISLEGAKESQNAFSSIGMSTNDKDVFYAVIEEIETILHEFIENVITFSLKETNNHKA